MLASANVKDEVVKMWGKRTILTPAVSFNSTQSSSIMTGAKRWTLMTQVPKVSKKAYGKCELSIT